MRKLLDESHLLYPEQLSKDQVIAEIRSCLEQSDEPLLKDPKLAWWNGIQRECWEKILNPIIILVSLQRERGLLANDGRAATERDFEFGLGVVGQHTAGTANTSWNGLDNQLHMAIRSAAWIAGIGPREAFGNPKLWSQAERWTERDSANGGKLIDLLHPDGSFAKKYLCKDRMEWLELSYTPSAVEVEPGVLEVRAVNRDIYEKRVKPFLGGE